VEAPNCVVGDCETEFPRPFIVNEIGQSDTHLYIAFKHRGGTTRTGSTVAAAEIGATVTTADCQVGRVTARGAVRQAAQYTSWVEIPLSELPEGELTLRLSGRVGTSDVQNSIPLRKTGSGVNYVGASQRRGYRETQIRHPTTGQMIKAATIEEQCEP
jgi:hypothetical protein